MLNKRTFIRRAYKAIQPLTSHKYYDDWWDGKNKVLQGILTQDGCGSAELINASYEGNMGEGDHRKVWRYTVTGCDRPIDLQIIASFCGTVADPMSAYDITVLMN